MPRLFDSDFEYSTGGSLEIEQRSSNCIEIHYIPSKQLIQQLDLKPNDAVAFRARLLRFDRRTQRLTIFPINTFPSQGVVNFLKPKYQRINAITVAEWNHFEIDVGHNLLDKNDSEAANGNFDLSNEVMVMSVLERLPSCFVKDFDFGLGLRQPYRFIINSVEELSDCTEIVISKHQDTGIDAKEKVFYISNDDFMQARRTIDRTIANSRTAVQSVNYAATHNLFASKIGQPSVPVRIGRSPLRRSLTEAAIRGEDSLTQVEQDEVLEVLAINAKSIAKDKPNKLTTLKKDIELVTLEALIERYREMVRIKVSESMWQEFLDANSFILSLAFGYPVVKIRGRASVGGHKLSGKGDNITDFLVKNKLTNNSAIIEIKKPSVKLLGRNTYRGETYPPSVELVGAINQTLSQKQYFEREISRIKDNSRITDLESYSVRCCLIIGTMPDDEDKKRSFELFRGNSKNVEIITFDELLEKLKSLKQLLTNQESDVTLNQEPIELPW